MRFLNWVVSHKWAMEESSAQYYLGVLESIVKRKIENLPLDKAAIQAETGKPLDNTYGVEMRDGVAVIDVDGPIFKRADMFDMMSGATSTEMMAQDLKDCLDDKKVKAILFNFNSPGGEAAGTNEFAEMIFQARGKKPIVAYVDGMAASAAYWMASACDEIVVDELGDVGSIGTVLTITDTKKRDAMMGIERHEYATPKNKRPKPGTKEGDALFLAYSQEGTDIFTTKVARNRGVDPETVTAEFGGGWLKQGQSAVEAGLADRVGSFEAVLSELSSGKWKAPQTGKNGGSKMNYEEIGRKAASLFGFGKSEDAEGETMTAPSTQPAPVAPTAPVAPQAPAQPATIAGMTEEQVLAMQEQLKAQSELLQAQRAVTAEAFAVQHAGRYLENGTDDEPSDRARFTSQATALHLKAQNGEAISTDELSALLSIPVAPQAAATARVGVLTEADLEGAAPYVDPGTQATVDPDVAAAEAYAEQQNRAGQ